MLDAALGGGDYGAPASLEAWHAVFVVVVVVVVIVVDVVYFGNVVVVAAIVIVVVFVTAARRKCSPFGGRETRRRFAGTR